MNDQSRGAGLQGPTGTWGAGQVRQDSKFRAGSGGLREGLFFGQVVQDQNEDENWVQRAVQISLRVADRRGSRETEGEGEGSRKQSNDGTTIDKT